MCTVQPVLSKHAQRSRQKNSYIKTFKTIKMIILLTTEGEKRKQGRQSVPESAILLGNENKCSTQPDTVISLLKYQHGTS